MMSDEIKNLLQAILGRLDEQGAGIQGINERLDRMEGNITQMRGDITEMKGDIKELKQGQADLHEDIRIVTQTLGEQDHEIRRLKYGKGRV